MKKIPWNKGRKGPPAWNKGIPLTVAQKEHLRKSVLGAPQQEAKTRVWMTYKHSAKKRQIEWNLTKEQFFNLTEQICHYCDGLPSNLSKAGHGNGDYVYNGIDRKNSDCGYCPENCVPCCAKCNYAKRRTPYKDFIEWVGRVSRKLAMAAVICLAWVAGAYAQRIPINSYKYKAAVIRESRLKGGLAAPTALFAAQLQQESGWNPTAHSSVGAEGLAQFMKPTAMWISKTFPADLPGAQSLDPNWAIRALVYYDYWNYARLPMYQTENENRWAAALSAYNGGLGWTLKDSKIGTCTLWFGCADKVKDGRSVSNLQQNRDYPEKIIHLFEPRYRAAGW